MFVVIVVYMFVVIVTKVLPYSEKNKLEWQGSAMSRHLGSICLILPFLS